jgi:hypothetical protein
MCLKPGRKRPQQMAVLPESIKLWHDDYLGRSDPAAWEASQSFMSELGFVDTEIDIEQMFVNQFMGR